jgi:hypothetical protein
MCSNFPYREDNHGIIVNEATKDNNVEIITVTQNCVIMLETNPVLIAIGKNTTTITQVIDTTVPPISAVPS